MYTWRKFRDHYIVVDGNGNTVCHCDTPEECREEIETLKTV